MIRRFDAMQRDERAHRHGRRGFGTALHDRLQFGDSGGPPSGGVALAVVPAALVSAAFLSEKPRRTRRETDTPVSTMMRPLLREARLLVFTDASMDVARRQENQPELKLR
ncbi:MULTISPECIES: hypothetical protein [unclassified Burkholderia]|uniref:hypothetical protein n=1 Tax=unclassified Burkholderia TaxID=2613784 RepID=UPI002ABE2345|nr:MULTISPECIES: hypothetical protein [unclassified Burkholderia]